LEISERNFETQRKETKQETGNDKKRNIDISKMNSLRKKVEITVLHHKEISVGSF
jgi:hypothetical protein